MRLLLIAAVVCLLPIYCGCERRAVDRHDVDATIDLALDNSNELRKVIEHYDGSPEKQEAACWLIANMRYHYGYETSLLDSVEVELAQLVGDTTLVSTIGERNRLKWQGRDIFSTPKVYDHRHIKAEYLIDNIDRAFAQYRKRPWNKHLSISEFCELILPYRIGDERLTDWRPLYESKYAARLDSVMTANMSLFEACELVRGWADEDGGYYNDEIRTPHRDAVALFHSPVKSCRDDCDKYVFAMRSCGIPATPHHLLISPDNGTSHQWVGVYDPDTKQYHPFGYDGMELSDSVLAHDGRTKGKIYAMGFGPNHARIRLLKDASYPENTVTANPFLYDVTSSYYGNNECEVSVAADARHVALGVYARNRFMIIDMGSVVKSGVAVFNDLEPGVIYFPLHTVSGRPCGQPFTITPSGRTVQFVPQSESTARVRLTRKMPLTKRHREWLDSLMVGLEIRAGGVSLVKIDEPFSNNYRRYELAIPVAADTLTIVPPEGQPLSLAELTLYGADGAPVEYRMEDDGLMHTLNDGDILSLFHAPYGQAVNIITGRRSKIKAIELIPRNDDNFVWPGQVYELMVFRHGKWQSCGIGTASGHDIEFDYPTGGVYLLRNHSKGKEEQVFIVTERGPQFALDLTESYYRDGIKIAR